MYIGVDPGNNGGIAVWDGKAASCRTIENDMDWLLETFCDLRRISGDFIVCIEKPSLHLGQMERESKKGKDGKNNSQMAVVYRLLKLFRSSYMVADAAHAHGFRYCEVQPRSWQGFLGLGKVTGETVTQRKTRYREIARQLYPGLHITTKTQDAVLLMEYMRRRWKLEPSWFNGKIITPKQTAVLTKLF